jgi:parvulin-like peptidyl-prolyl isomerase
LPRKRRQGKIPTPAWEQHHSVLTRSFLGRSPKFYGLVGAVLLVVAAFGVIGYAVASDYFADKNRPSSTAVRVDDAKYNPALPAVSRHSCRPLVALRRPGPDRHPQMIQQIVEEEIMRRFGNEQGAAASEDEINTDIATRMGLSGKDDPKFQARFQEELARSGINESHYRDLSASAVIRKEILDKFTSEVPASAESIRYRQIVVRDQAEADDIKSQIDGGADFAALAQEKSLDSTTKSAGGEVGWVPRGILDPKVEEQLFGQELNVITTYVTESGAFVLPG